MTQQEPPSTLRVVENFFSDVRHRREILRFAQNDKLP
jgi:hypothetical protein